ncbi:MAG: hypothetical protein DWQ04_23785 [Chloroflexi bacterium]|nr:MAG: hypothetical protein DWQ04_23785 [Chloroflexota bacterium]
MAEEMSMWKGSVQYNEESIGVVLTLIDNEGVLTGRLQVMDPENSGLHEMGIISTGSKVDNTVTFETNTELEVNAMQDTDSLIGTILFPPRNEEGSFEADIKLKESTVLYLPFVRR